LFGWGRIGPGIGKIDTAVGLHHDIIGTVQAPALKAVGKHGEAAVEFLPGHTPAVMLAGNEAALEVAREPIGTVRRLLKHGHALARRIFHALVVMDITEQQVPAFFPPERTFGWPQRSAKALGQHLDGLRWGEDLFEFRSELLNARARLGAYPTAMTSYGQAACCQSHMQYLSA
jgi:hypothetical protein